MSKWLSPYFPGLTQYCNGTIEAWQAIRSPSPRRIWTKRMQDFHRALHDGDVLKALEFLSEFSFLPLPRAAIDDGRYTWWSPFDTLDYADREAARDRREVPNLYQTSDSPRRLADRAYLRCCLWQYLHGDATAAELVAAAELRAKLEKAERENDVVAIL